MAREEKKRGKAEALYASHRSVRREGQKEGEGQNICDAGRHLEKPGEENQQAKYAQKMTCGGNNFFTKICRSYEQHKIVEKHTRGGGGNRYKRRHASRPECTA